MKKETVSLNAKEQQRLMVLNQVISGDLTGQEAAVLMDLSVRQMRRLMAAYRKEGAVALAHGNRGRMPVHALSAAIKERLVAAAQTTYSACNFAHLRDLLNEREGLKVSHPSVWRVLRAAGMRSPYRRRRPQHRARRQRMPQEGVLIQMDGSHHPWLGDRGPVLTLLLAIDDATGTPPYALFCAQEDTKGYFLLLKGIIERKGIPLGLYTDRHAVFRATHPAAASTDADQEREPTQFGRALKEMGIVAIFAQSPEAKGRIERANETFQDRLVVELDLAGASSVEQANCILWGFLPRFSGRFGVPAAEPGSAYRPVEEGFDLDGVLCFKEWRRVAKDNTVQYHGQNLQLFPSMERLSYARARVEVQERLDGRVLVSYRGKMLTPGEAPSLAAELRMRAASALHRCAEPAMVDQPEAIAPCGGAVPELAAAGSCADETIDEPITVPEPQPRKIWYEDSAMLQRHNQLVKEGMERARQRGKRIGRPRVTDREGFPERLTDALAKLDSGEWSRRRTAKELKIGYATLKRTLDGRSAQPAGDAGTSAAVPKPDTQPHDIPPATAMGEMGDIFTETLG